MLEFNSFIIEIFFIEQKKKLKNVILLYVRISNITYFTHITYYESAKNNFMYSLLMETYIFYCSS